MKLHKLTIKNIASIENAEIEFDRPPLSDSPIFLITGDTGAGKTTILNAICLVLYNKAPSLETIGTAENDREGIRTDNPRQLVRRGTGQAEIELTFEDSNGKNYKAKWSVRRARGKADGKMQKTERMIEDLTEGVTYGKDDEIKDIIARATGLTFDQFTRTTMLAQGQFATFMKAKDADKSDILEKLTGTDVYARIGNRIFETFIAKKDEVSAIENEIKGQSEHLLSDAEIKEMNQAMQSKSTQTAELTSYINTLNSIILWLTQYALLKKEAETRNENLRKAYEVLASDDNKDKTSLVESWKKTIEIRNLIAENTAACRQAESVQHQLNETVNTGYTPILKGLEWLRNKSNELIETKQTLDLEISRESHNAKLYESAPLIREKANSIIKQTTTSNTLYAEYEKQIADYKKSLQSESSLNDKLKKASEAYDEIATEANRISADIGNTDIAALTEDVNSCNATVTKLNNQRQLIETYHIRIDEHRSSLSLMRGAIEAEVKTRDGLLEAKKQAPMAEKNHTDRLNILQARMQLNDHINQLRQRFADVHECPLCGSKVTELLPQNILDVALEDARKEEKEARNILDSINRTIASLEVKLVSQEAETKAKTEDEQRKRKALDAAEKEVSSSLKEYKEEDVLSEIENRRKKALEDQSIAKKALDTALAIRKNYDDTLKSAEKARKEMEKAKSMLLERQNITQSLKAKAESTLLLSKQAKDSANTILSEINLIISNFAIATIATCIDISNKIDLLAANYTDSIKRSESVDRQIKEINDTVERCESLLIPIKDMIKYADIEIYGSSELNDIEKEISLFSERLNRLEGQLTSLTAKISSTEKEIAEYLTNDNAYTREKLTQIDKYSKEKISEYENHIKRNEENVASARGAVEVIKKQIEDHEAIRPDMPDVPDIATLTNQRDEATSTRDAYIKECAEIEAKIKTDSATKAVLKIKLELLENKRKEKENWQTLDTLYGGAGGRKFRNLAQSYVLRALLAKANHYLKRLNNRYTLDCEDGSLTINVIDHHQGDCARNVGLLSGGEGFIVSLSLALGLSAISKQKIDVDVLFIDEGFGSLDQDTLDTVITTLNNLHRIGNRRIGVISHVEALKENILTQIRVEHDTPTSSKVVVYPQP